MSFQNKYYAYKLRKEGGHMLYLIRHAEDDERYVGSWSDASILDKEKERVKQQGIYIKNNLNIKNIYSSDIRRAVETAEIIGSVLNIPIKLDKNLREQNKGTLTGKLKETLSEEENNLLLNQQIDTLFPEGETLEDLYNRTISYLEEMKKYEDNSLVVTHRGVINAIYYYLNNIPLDMNKKKFNVDHLSIHELDIEKKLIRRIK